MNLTALIQQASATIAPSWPLDQMIAVNPYWGYRQVPFQQAAKQLQQQAATPLHMPLRYYAECWQQQQIRSEHLLAAARELGLPYQPQHCVAALEQAEQAPTPPPLLSDVRDQQRDLQQHPAWCDTITHQISQFCAAYFDQHQADWHPPGHIGLYQSWQATLSHDHSVALLMQSPEIPMRARQLSSSAYGQIEQVLQRLEVPADQHFALLTAVLYRISGWASWCSYLAWQAQLQQRQDESLLELLAIRLSWELLLDDGARGEESLWHVWHQQWQQYWQQHTQVGTAQSLDTAAEQWQVRMVWQRAHELSYQQQLAAQFATAAQTDTAASARPWLQAAFCIDVRSEVYRRHLEAQDAGIATLGFAGFFGLPIAYTPLGTNLQRPQLPGLLAAQFVVQDASDDDRVDQVHAQQRQSQLAAAASWQPFKLLPSASFSLVETIGLGFAKQLLQRSLRRASTVTEPCPVAADGLQPRLQAPLAQRIDLAEGALRGMQLDRQQAPLVLLVGHAGQSSNNPQQAGLDCGACCGQSGEINAKALAHLLNQPEVRQGLQARGISVNPETRFVAALHHTTTDRLELYLSHAERQALAGTLARLEPLLAHASMACAAERAGALALPAALSPVDRLAALRARSRDWAQTRPEWALANNAALVIGPRERTKNLDLQGRSFLHEYDPAQDADGALLTQIMTAPMVVTNWINMQYFASTVDPKRYGSGNKTLHNVVGGRLGVFEGNGGDLRIGLAWQSVHNGTQFCHQPLRLTVVIDAPAARIEQIIASQPVVRDLVLNQWLYLARITPGGLHFYQAGQWQPLSLALT